MAGLGNIKSKRSRVTGPAKDTIALGAARSGRATTALKAERLGNVTTALRGAGVARALWMLLN